MSGSVDVVVEEEESECVVDSMKLKWCFEYKLFTFFTR